MSGEKTEQPTAKKLRDARQKGQVAKSKDLASTAVLAAILAVLLGLWNSLIDQVRAMILLPGQLYEAGFGKALEVATDAMLAFSVSLLMPVLLATVIAGIVGNVAQSGFLFSLEALKPQGQRLNPISNAQNMFGKKGMVEFLKSIAKTVLLAIIVYVVVEDSLDALIKAPYCGLPCVEAIGGALVKEMLLYVGAVFAVIAIADFVLQKRMHIKDLMMSKEDIKQEFKEAEGDPHIKSKRKHLHQEMAMNSTAQAVRKATVLVTNPTHIAIALYYDKDKTPLPMVVAKGHDLLARRMIEIAEEEGIPVMQNVPLARALDEQAEVDAYIPSDLLTPVAEVLRWVQSLDRG